MGASSIVGRGQGHGKSYCLIPFQVFPQYLGTSRSSDSNCFELFFLTGGVWGCLGRSSVKAANSYPTMNLNTRKNNTARIQLQLNVILLCTPRLEAEAYSWWQKLVVISPRKKWVWRSIRRWWPCNGLINKQQLEDGCYWNNPDR